MEKWQQPYFDGDGKLSGKEALINEVRGAGSLVTVPLSSPIATLAVTGVAIGIGAFVSAPVLLTAGAIVGGCVGLYHAGKAAYNFATANGDEKTLAEAHLNTGKAVVELPIAAVSGKIGYSKYKAVQKTVKPTKSFHDPITKAHKAMYRIDPETANHGRRVSRIAKDIGISVGMDAEEAKKMSAAAVLHDIGKIDDPQITELINIPGKLTGPQAQVVKTHSEIGAKHLSRIEGVPEEAVLYAKYHHDSHPDLVNTGLPMKTIKKVEILTSADVTDALTGKGRPYLPQRSIREALPDIKKVLEEKINPEWLPDFMKAIEALPN